MARLSEHGIRLSSMSPSYLDSNSTSHTWPFSAVAELVDNASDPGVTAKQIWIDVANVKGHHCLSFTDNGSGMTPNKLHKMLSFGFTEKGSGKGSHQAIGVYGNGFKSGSMRLGRDALIFTKNGGCQSVGMLSQTFLQAIKAQAVIVPITPFNQQTKSLIITEDSEASLRAILTHSIFKSVFELQEQLDSIPGKKGTKILIWNIRRNKDGKPEFDFDTDTEDIRLPEIHSEEMEGVKSKKSYFGPRRTEHIVPEMDYSLRAYLSILYLKPRIQIVLRQKKVQTKLVAKSLSMIENDVYKPQFINERVKITFGFNQKNKDHYGIMMYHNNRLIKSYEKVGCQIKSSGQRSGVGVIGVIECNFLKPAHNKQDFEYTKEYRLTIAALGLKLNDYWREKKEKKAKERAFQALEKNSVQGSKREKEEDDDEEEEEEEEVDVSWIQCEECMKWRGIPTHLFKGKLPERFTCSQHPNSHLRSCLVPEEPEETEEELTPSYEKTHKKQEQAPAKRRGRSVEGNKDRAPTQGRRASEPPSDTREDEALVDKTESQNKDRKSSTEPTHSKGNKRKATWSTSEANTKSPKHTETIDLSGEEEEKNTVPTTTTTEKTSETDDTNSKTTQTPNTMSQEDKTQTSTESPAADSTQNPPEQQASQDPQPKEPPRITSGSLVWPPSLNPQSSMAWSHPLPPAQTVVVPPLSRTTRQSVSPLTVEGLDRPALTQRLAQLEREAKRLRKTLGLQEPAVEAAVLVEGEVSGLAGEGVAVPSVQNKESNAENQTKATSSTAAKTTRPQSETQSSLQKNSSPSGQQEAPTSPTDELHWSKALAQLQSQNQALFTEVNKLKREREQLLSKPRQAERETRDKRDQGTSTPSNANDSIALDRLRAIRRNVVSLLSSILPNLDMHGISYDTGDVDSILQQIIQANNL
ncbi:MORC family CW-type zinc finger protein 4 [Astyanax mexicanus]|uniref:MORC family CW-type zinc finger protein 4 n=1 Tax=Astyanax mexicanus TaxID=7994 RepID=UPI0020CB39E5|nr:MORC family CW-type zinc finger protein 4 [Astyanax mexicanus]